MILADTSVWVDHLSRGAEGLAILLDEEKVVMHPFVIGELACGNIRNRRQVLHLLRALPAASIASDDEALAMIRLSGYGERRAQQLSGGERQRVVLARALATGAKVLLLDEPTANLDLAHQALMFQLVRERCLDNGTSAVVITHDLNLASAFADEIIMLKEGAVAAHGKPSKVLTAETVRDVFKVDVLLDENPASRKVRVTALY